MKTIQENLQTIAESTAAIKQAIIDKGGEITGDITTWANAINGISGGGNSDSTEETIVFRGTMSYQMTSVNIVGTLYAPETIFNGYLVMMTHYMRLITSYQWISSSTTSINMSLDYGEPLSGTESPILILMYRTAEEDYYGKFRAAVVRFENISGDSSN